MKFIVKIFVTMMFLLSFSIISQPSKVYAAECVKTNGQKVQIPETITEQTAQNEFCSNNGATLVFSATEIDGCDKGSAFFGFPKWYKYLEAVEFTDPVTNRVQCQPTIKGINEIWLIVAAVVEILLRVGALLAIGFIVYGGVTYVLSQGQPDKTKQSLKTIIDALVGLAISIIATALVTFVAGRF